MTDQYALAPKAALELIQAAGVDDAAKVIRDHAAAGLLRSYASSQITLDANGTRAQVRGAAVSAETWERMIRSDVHDDVWGGGTVRVQGSNLLGGDPALNVTGITFHAGDIDKLAQHHRPARRQVTVKGTGDELAATAIVEAAVSHDTPLGKSQQTPDLSALNAGALLLTVKQVQAALGISRTTVYKLVGEAKLERPQGETRITSVSVRRYAEITA